MNKKFSTFLVAMLLAGGSLFSGVNAQTTLLSGNNFTATTEGEYYILRVVSGTPSTAPDAGQVSLTVNKGEFTYAAADQVASQNIWKAVPVKQNGKVLGYSLVNANGVKLAFSEKVNAGVTSYEYSTDGTISTFEFNGLQVKAVGVDLYLAWDYTANQPKLVAVSDIANSGTSKPCYNLAFGIYTLDPSAITRTDLNNKLKSGFGLGIGYLKDGKADKFTEYTLKGGEAFAGTLKANDEITDNTNLGVTFTALADNTESYLYNANAKKFVVLLNQKWSKQNTDLIPATGDLLKGYKFGLMTAKELIEALIADAKETDAAKKTIKSYVFRISQPNVVIDEPLEVAVKIDTEWAELLVAEVDGSYLLTTAKASTVDKKADYASTTYVKFGQGNNFDASKYYGYAINIKGVKGTNNGKTLVPNATTATWENADYVAFSKPEGQWIITEDVNGLALTNRETKTVSDFAIGSLRHKSGDVYYSDDSEYEITKVIELGGESFAYYGNYKQDDANNGNAQTYAITLVNKVTGKLNYVGFDGEGKVVLTDNAAAAINFNMKKTATTDIMGDDGKIKSEKATDLFRITNDIMVYNKDDEAWELKEDGDTISYYRYELEYNGKYLATSGDKLDLITESETVSADNYVVKFKEGTTVNVINVEDTDADNVTNAEELLDENMLYFDFNYAELRQAKNIYNWVANAQLEMLGNAPAVYRTTAAPDTLEFFRTEYADEFLFEHGEFLGMTYNREKYNPSIFVDTAYVRGETKKPFYMLAVGVDKTDATQKCPICGKEDCEHAEEIPGMIAARYLVSFTDSVAAHRAELNNKFYYAGTTMTKLGFVPAVHHVDTLVIETPSKKVLVGDQKINPAKFAFRIVDAETEDFVIETALRNSLSDASQGYKIAYVKWHNGCPVLTEKLNEAEVFNVRETSETPTANDEISTESVSVIATDGAVIIKGAEGKKVAISNVLGQTVANTMITSSEATISVPAGIVVVAIEGEAAVKAIVK